jgi:putative spermidine/putrescine transport system substrate-binding protein
MIRQREADVERACALLRKILVQTRGLDRRALLRGLGEAVGSAMLSPLAGLAARAQSKPVTYFSYGGAWKKAIMAAFGVPFTRKTSIPVQYQEPYNFGKLLAMHRAHAQQIDALTASGMEVILAEREGMLTPLDWSLIDKSALSDVQLERPNVIGGVSQSMNVTYSTKKWPGTEHPILPDRRGPRVPQPRSHQAAYQGLVVRQFAVPAIDGAGRGRPDPHDQRSRHAVDPRSQGALCVGLE